MYAKRFLKTLSHTCHFWVPLLFIRTNTVRTAHFSKKSLGSDVGEIKKMSEKFKKKSVLTPRNAQEKSNTVL